MKCYRAYRLVVDRETYTISVLVDPALLVMITTRRSRVLIGKCNCIIHRGSTCCFLKLMAVSTINLPFQIIWKNSYRRKSIKDGDPQAGFNSNSRLQLMVAGID